MSIRDSINTSIKNIANDIASMIQSRANNTLSNLTDEGVEYIKELAEIKAGEYANQELSNLTATGLSQYNVFCVNTGEVDEDGNPAFLTITTGSVIPENPTSGNLDESQELIVQNAEDSSDDTDDTDENTDEDTTTATQTLSTSGSFDITTANGKIYTITDTLTLDISDYEDGEYNVYVNPVDLTLSVKSHTLTAGSAFPSDAVSGDYLLNTSQVPYDLQEITITTETDEETGEETTTSTVTKGLNLVLAGTVTISSGEVSLKLNSYNSSSVVGSSSSSIGAPVMTLSDTLDDNEIWLEGAEVSKTTYSALYAIYGDTYGTPEDDSNFVLPDFRGRVPWGGEDGTYGYLSAGLPNITGNFYASVNFISGNGAFSSVSYSAAQTSSYSSTACGMSFNASRSSSIYGSSSTVQPPSIKVRVKTRYI